MAYAPFPPQTTNPYALGHITGTSQVVTNATNASPIAVTVTAHGYATGQMVRIASVGGNTNANGDWTITVIDPNTFSLNGSTGNAGYTSGGTAVRFALPITFNVPALAGFGYAVNSITFNAFSSNTGNIYIGASTLKRTSPFTDVVYVMKPGTTQNLPFFSPGNSNIISIDQWYVDWDTVGEGVLVSVFTR